MNQLKQEVSVLIKKVNSVKIKNEELVKFLISKLGNEKINEIYDLEVKEDTGEILIKYVEEVSKDYSKITISLSEYNALKESDLFLASLEAVGLDNWNGYNDAVNEYNKNKKF